jgi:hypothetical protein
MSKDIIKDVLEDCWPKAYPRTVEFFREQLANYKEQCGYEMDRSMQRLIWYSPPFKKIREFEDEIEEFVESFELGDLQELMAWASNSAGSINWEDGLAILKSVLKTRLNK